MPSQLQKNIATYIGHFRDQHEKILLVDERLHRKLLIVSMLSALAEGRYPDLNGDANKFVKLIEEYSDWEHATRLSISQLHMHIIKRGQTPPKLAKSFLNEVSRLYEAWRKLRNPSASVDLGDDPCSADILPSSPTDEEKNLVKKVIHSSLLYKYRSKLVHEFREPGDGFEYDERDPTPYYHSVIDNLAPPKELVYPTKWFLDLPLPILTGLESYYVSSCTNPNDSYNFGSPWG